MNRQFVIKGERAKDVNVDLRFSVDDESLVHITINNAIIASLMMNERGKIHLDIATFQEEDPRFDTLKEAGMLFKQAKGGSKRGMRTIKYAENI